MHSDIIWASSFTHSLFPIGEQGVRRIIREDESSELRSGICEPGHLVLKEQVFPLPIQEFQWVEILRLLSSKDLLLDLCTARFRKGMTAVTGVYTEQRSYQHFLEDHYGSLFSNAVWKDYLLRRWGRTPDRLSAQLGRLLHSKVNLENVNQSEYRGAIGEITALQTDSSIKVQTKTDELTAERVWIDAPIHKICSFLDDVPRPIQVDLEYLSYLEQRYISVTGLIEGVLHIVDDAPVFAVIPTRENGGVALLSNDRVMNIAELEVWCETFDLEITGDIQSIPNFTPMWDQGTYTRYLRILEYLVDRGVYPIGLGAYTPCSAWQHQQFIRALLSGEGASDAHRRLFDPFVKKVSFRNFSFR